MTNPRTDTLSVVDGASNAVVATVPLGTWPVGVAVNPRTNRIYVANDNTNNVSVIDGASNTVVAAVAIGVHSTPPARWPSIPTRTGSNQKAVT